MWRLVFLVLTLQVVACAQPADETSAGAVRPTPGNLPRAGFANADLSRGEVLALSCRACHTFGAGEDHLLGPNLHGLFGRATASAPGFEYSAALREADFVWTPDRLDTWLAEPNGFLPGNNMAFAGFNAESDRNDLLAYLLQVTANSSP